MENKSEIIKNIKNIEKSEFSKIFGATPKSLREANTLFPNQFLDSYNSLFRENNPY